MYSRLNFWELLENNFLQAGCSSYRSTNSHWCYSICSSTELTVHNMQIQHVGHVTVKALVTTVTWYWRTDQSEVQLGVTTWCLQYLRTLQKHLHRDPTALETTDRSRI